MQCNFHIVLNKIINAMTDYYLAHYASGCCFCCLSPQLKTNKSVIILPLSCKQHSVAKQKILHMINGPTFMSSSADIINNKRCSAQGWQYSANGPKMNEWYLPPHPRVNEKSKAQCHFLLLQSSDLHFLLFLSSLLPFPQPDTTHTSQIFLLFLSSFYPFLPSP